MTVLVVGFYGEGGRDYTFLKTIVERVLIHYLPVTDILPIPIEIREAGLSHPERFVKMSEKAEGYDFVIFHADADAPDIEKAIEYRFKPGYELVAERESGVNKHIVPVIPVRTTEAWMLTDLQAFQAVIGTDKTHKELGFPHHPHMVEALHNPDAKTIFESALKLSLGKKRLRKFNLPDDIYIPLAERIDLEQLRKVPAFQYFEEQLVRILTDLRFIE